MGGKSAQCDGMFRISTISYCYGNIPQESMIFRSPERSVTGQSPKFFFTKVRQPVQRRGGRARLECRVSGNGHFPIPRANVLANIAAEDVVGNRGMVDVRYGASLFNREIRNAKARVERPAPIRRGNQGQGGARVN